MPTGPALTCKLMKWADDVLLAEFTGEVEMDTANDFRNRLFAVIQRQPRGLAIDLEKIDYMDSSGVAVMIEALRWCTRTGTRMLLVAPSSAVTRAKHVVHLGSAFAVAQNRDAAWAIFAGDNLLPKE